MKRQTITWIAGALMLAPALAWAQPKTPDDFYAEGKTQYDLGNFEKAIEAFNKFLALNKGKDPVAQQEIADEVKSLGAAPPPVTATPTAPPPATDTPKPTPPKKKPVKKKKVVKKPA